MLKTRPTSNNNKIEDQITSKIKMKNDFAFDDADEDEATEKGEVIVDEKEEEVMLDEKVVEVVVDEKVVEVMADEKVTVVKKDVEATVDETEAMVVEKGVEVTVDEKEAMVVEEDIEVTVDKKDVEVMVDEKDAEVLKDEDVMVDEKEINKEYILTLKDDSIEFPLGTCKNEASMNEMTLEEFYPITVIGRCEVKHSDDSDRRVVDITVDTKGKFCIVDLPSPEDIAVVIDKAVLQGAKLLIVKSMSNSGINIPAFVVSITTLQKMSVCCNLQGRLQPKKVQSSATFEEPLDPVHESKREQSTNLINEGHEMNPINLVPTSDSHPLSEGEDVTNVLQVVTMLTGKDRFASSDFPLPTYIVELILFNFDDQPEPNVLKLSPTSLMHDTLICGKLYDIIWLPDVTQKSGSPKKPYIQVKVKDCVCACLYREPTTLTEVIDEAISSNATAIFVLTKPSIDTNFPVFVLNENVLKSLLFSKSATVIFELNSPVSHQPDYNIQPLPLHISFPSESSSGLEQFRNDSKEEPYIEIARRHEGKRKGFISRAIESVFGKEPFLQNHNENDICYLEALEKVQSVDLVEVSSEVMDYLKAMNYEIKLGYFAAFAHLCNSSNQVQLIDKVMNCLRNFSVSEEQNKFLQMTKPPKKATYRFEPPHQALYFFLINNVSRWADVDQNGNYNIISRNGIILLSKCGLSRKQMVTKHWELLRSFISPTIISNYNDDFVKFLGGDDTMTTLLLLQRDFCNFVGALEFRPMFTEKKQIFTPNSFTWLRYLAEVDLKKNSFNSTSMWKAVTANVFISYGDTMKLFETFVEAIGLHTVENIKAMSAFVASVNNNSYLNLVRNALIKKFASNTFSLQTLSCLFDLSLGNLVGYPSVTTAFKDFIKRKMNASCTLPVDQKLLLLDLAYKKCAKEKWIQQDKSAEHFLREHLLKVLEMTNQRNAFPLLCDCLKLAADKKNLFCLSHQDIADTNNLKEIAHIAARNSIQEIISNPTVIKNIPTSAIEGPILYDMIVGELLWLLQRKYSSIEEATKFYRRVIHGETLSTDSPALHISQDLLLFSLRKWKPRSIIDIKAKHKPTIDVIFSDFVSGSQIFKNTSRKHDEFIGYRSCIEKLVRTWISSFRKDEVTSNDLIHVINSLKAMTWECFERFTGISLPSLTELVDKKEENDHMAKTIKELLYIHVDDKKILISRILNEYRCAPGKELDALLQSYEHDLVNLNATKTNTDFSFDNKSILDFMHVYKETFALCAYFQLNQSLLFREFVFTRNGKLHSIETLKKSVLEAYNHIADMFGSEMHYQQVVHAMSILDSSENLDAEVQVLRNCPTLQISALNIVNFHVIQFLSDLEHPLKKFVKCLEMFEFAIPDEDSSFPDIKHNVTTFYDTTISSPIHTCLHFFNFVVDSFCLISSENDKKKIQDFKKVMPWMNLLGFVSSHPELWYYVNEMEWFGEIGLKRFYEEYNNVTNVLLGQAASYEMSLLVSLEPVVRTLSILGKFKHIKTILKLFRCFERNSDLVASVKGVTLENHITQIHAKLSEIKEWFTSGVDEVAASHSLFSKAIDSGKFLIVKEDARHVLALVVQGKTTEISLYGESLDQFILQLSLIQNESKSTAGVMQVFIEQFQLLKAASRNFIIMEDVGFSGISISSFLCLAGADHIDVARNLNKISYEHLNDFKSWLSRIRWQYKVSMLYWKEELRHIYDCLFVLPNNQNLDFAFRLRYFWKEVLDDNGTFCRVLATVVDRNRGNHSSWLEEVSHIVDDINRSMSDNTVKLICYEKSEITLHSLCCEDKDVPLSTFIILQQIYKGRLPQLFEILDGTIPCSEDRFCLFLDRVKAFPSLKFTLLGADKLECKNLELLLSFLTNREVESLGICLHCIQNGDSLIHTAPWIDGKSWSKESLLTCTSDWITKINVYTSIFVISDINSGSGKTFFIKEKLKEYCKAKDERRSASITVHELTTISTLVRDLRSKLNDCEESFALHVSFNYLPVSTENERWLVEMNHFFFSLIILRFVYDANTATSFSVTRDFRLFIEIPNGAQVSRSWLNKNIPIIAYSAKFQDIRIPYRIDNKARRVCTYLRAYENGTINRKYDSACSKRIVLVLDTSGSMNGEPFKAAVNNAVSIFDSHIVSGDEFGVILFDHQVHNVIPIQAVDDNRTPLRDRILQVPYYGGGTSMYAALRYVLGDLFNIDCNIETWIICLTDGVSDNKEYDNFRSEVLKSLENQHLVTIGINLNHAYEQGLRLICRKFADVECKGFFVRADGTIAGMNRAFDVVKSRIPVSKTFDRDGEMSDEECRQYILKYLPGFVQADDLINQSFWIRFLYRRVKVFDNNESFNYNEEYDNLGSSLMEIMLLEVDRLISNNYQRDWNEQNHIQLIYDFAIPQNPLFRLVCTAPDQLEPELKEKLASFKLPGFQVPDKREIDNRVSLDFFLSAALGVPLHLQEDGLFKIQCIDDHGFVLTIDFTMKLLSIHERISCHIPCIIEGETGVSKTALTKMYSILRNHSMNVKAQEETAKDLTSIVSQILHEGFALPSASAAFERLDKALESDSTGVLSNRITELLKEKALGRPAIFVEILQEASCAARSFLDAFNNSTLEKTFYEINVDASLTEDDFVEKFKEINAVAKKVFRSDATIVVFLDEINTSTVLGLLKEIVVDHSILGNMLMGNIVVVAACNPPRNQIQTTTRERDLGKTWVTGHYQVSELPTSMQKLKWSFGALSSYQEKEFIFRRMQRLHGQRMTYLAASLTEIVSTSHDMIRKFATVNIFDNLMKIASTETNVSTQSEVKIRADERAKSAVSLRDIQRVFALYSFFLSDMLDVLYPEELDRSAMLLSVAIVYYFRLDNKSREKFVEVIDSLPTESNQNFNILDVLNKSIDRVLSETKIPVGIATTRGLKENIFATVVCSLSQTPLIIVGPPGASKTLAVNIVGDNAHGYDSHSEFYKKRPRLSLFHYQCSKKSTSKEIAAVFSQAFTRQENVDSAKNRCVVFMDEAGLPEEEKESLKVLHYLLEGHMSAKTNVGFVAISNHILDAAKSNRCIMLLRQDLDDDEMLAIATGVLFDFRQDGLTTAHDVDVDGEFVSIKNFAECLCVSYASLFDVNSPILDLNTFYGLRDFIYLLKSIRSMSRVESMRLVISTRDIMYAIERNFNGVSGPELRQVIACFLKPFSRYFHIKTEMLEASLRDPITVLKDALRGECWENQWTRPRFKLIIDCTDDDSILRLLQMSGILDSSGKSLHKLSNLPDDVDFERIRLVSSVKFAAMQGSFAILSQTEAVNESFYDLFNQRFHELTKQDGSKTMFANIAVGGISRRSLVLPTFECVIHLRESNLMEIPAPFLNRFEKYRLTLHDVFVSSWSRVSLLTDIVKRAVTRSSQILTVSAFCGERESLCWINNTQTLESIFVDMLPSLNRHATKAQPYVEESRTAFGQSLATLLEMCTSLRAVTHHVDTCVQLALDKFPCDMVNSIERLIQGSFTVASLRDLLFSRSNHSTIDDTTVTVVSSILQMVLTRIATFKITQLATPETIFINRSNIPVELIDEYFSNCHFSLKQHLSKHENGPVLSVVHTRSDQVIHMIPTLPADRTIEIAQDLDVARTLIHDKPQTLVVEHLNRLRSESMVRTSIEAWLSHEIRRIYIVFVDMSLCRSFDQVNFIRMQVEQSLAQKEGHGKAFALVLHYPPSSSLNSRCYPALFLGGWEHIFLDSVGDGSVVELDKYISHACVSDDFGAKGRDNCEKLLLKTILPRILPHLASQALFYREQTHLRADSFTDRKVLLTSLLSFSIHSTTIEKLLCKNFAAMWCDHIFMRVTHRCSISLANGTTQLSLTMLIQRAMVQIFQTYAIDVLVLANQWKNLDLLSCSLQHKRKKNTDTLKLFESVLGELPTVPLEELLLQRRRYHSMHLIPLPVNANLGVARFPFFHMISTYLDELSESIVEALLKEKNASGVTTCSISGSDILQRMMKEVNAERDETETLDIYDRRKLVKNVVHFVLENHSNRNDLEDTLFHSYLKQYIEWNIGCSADLMFLKWWETQFQKLGDLAFYNIVAIQAIFKANEMDVIQVASAIILTESLDLGLHEVLDDEIVNCQDPYVLVMQTMKRMTTGSQDSTSKNLWPLLLSSMFHRTETRNNGLEINNVVTKLRQIGLHHGLKTGNGTKLTVKGDFPLKNIYSGDFDDASTAPLVSLKQFVHNLEDDEKKKALGFLLQRFLSPEWLRITRKYLPTDLEILFDCIEKGELSGSLAVGLLKSSILSSRSSMDNTIYGFSLNVLLQINERLRPEPTTQYRDNDVNRCLPHYIPEWLKNKSCPVHDADSTDSKRMKYLVNYRSFVDGELACVVFNVFCSLFAAEASSLSSSEMFLILLRELDSELHVNKQMYTQLARLRKLGTSSSISGTQIVMIAVSARIVCFVAKVASEISQEMSAAVLVGPYADEAMVFLDELMSLNHVARWTDLFMATILRLRGDGTLSSALMGPLVSFEWCDEWAAGIPSSSGEIVEKLRLSEAALVDVIQEEQWKTNHFRLCPNCNEPFEVYALNCGQFECGSDAHGGTRTRLGCGTKFNISNAPQYVVNAEKVATAQIQVNELRTKIDRFNKCNNMWETARLMKIPHIVDIDCDYSQDQLLPHASLLMEEGSNLPHERSLSCLRILREYSSFAPLFELLPDIIETFRHLVTKEFAIATTLSGILTKDILCERFDSAQVHHTLELWERVKIGFDVFLADHKQQINYECEQLTIPFEKLENAKLISLLSEDTHPTQNDFLFLVINDAILKYNTFIDKLSSVCLASIDRSSKMVSPRFIIRGFGATLRIGKVAPVSLNTLSWVAACSWNSNTELFDWNKVEILLDELINLHHVPLLITNPLTNLREKFCFRNDIVQIAGIYETCNIVDIDKYGNFHANNHDHGLVDEVHQTLNHLRLFEGNVDARRIIPQIFQGFDYQRIVSLLQGCGKILDEVLLMHTEANFERLELLLDLDRKSKSLTLLLQEFGFPEMEEKQLRFFLGQNSEQFVELIHYCGYQLASEGYLFFNLPVHVSDPFTESMTLELKEKVNVLASEHSPRALVKYIEEFVRDVLGFYEIQIVAEAIKSNTSLLSYLASQNFCDVSDPIYAALPETISIRNYVSLRQSLQQIKLYYIYFSCKEEKAISTTDKEQAENRSSAIGSKLGRCWLWDDTGHVGQSETKNENYSVQADPPLGQWKLWFERVPNIHQPLLKEMEVCHDRKLSAQVIESGNNFVDNAVTQPTIDIEMEIVEEDDIEKLHKTRAAITLQLWWRLKYEQIKNSDGMIYEYLECSDNRLSNLEKDVKDSRSKLDTNIPPETKPLNNLAPLQVMYGTDDDERRMRTWIDEKSLPQSVSDTLISLGIRSIDDICSLFSEAFDEDEVKDILSHLKPFDRMKLRKAAKLISATIETSNWLEEMD